MERLATLTLEQELYNNLEDSIRVRINFENGAGSLSDADKDLLVMRTLRAVAALRGARFDISALENELRAKLLRLSAKLN